jgi:hypothetical protein
MKVYETIVSQKGKIVLEGLPVEPGEKVTVIVFKEVPKSRGCKHPLLGKVKICKRKYSLRGKPVVYKRPFDGVAEEDWAVLK